MPYMVMRLHKWVTYGKIEKKLTGPDGLIGYIPVFETQDQADVFASEENDQVVKVEYGDQGDTGDTQK